MGSVFCPTAISYDKHNGLYRCLYLGTVLADMSSVAIAFSLLSDGSTIRHQHGTPDSVMNWFQWAKSTYTKYKLTSFVDELCYIVSEEWDLVELNKIVHDDGYLAVFLRKAGINPESLKYFGPDNHPRGSFSSSAGETSPLSV